MLRETQWSRLWPHFPGVYSLPQMALTNGTKLGPYEIVAPLGAGGMGVVYRARDTRLERTVAIKILPPHLSSDPTLRQRFEHEAKTISGLNHPHICTLYDVGKQDGIDFLVMEYVEGETLATRLEKGPLPLEQVLKFGVQIADALDKAHRNGIVHRDVKPGNIMLTKSGVKLLDFGLAKVTVPLSTGNTLTAAATLSSPVTQAGTIVGTFQYMSPEQVEGKEVDGRSDIFSFGSVLYEMVTGRRAFQGKSNLSVASAVLEKDPEPISSLQPMTPPALDRAIRRCLAKDPENRWQTARDLELELRWIAEAGSQAGVQGPTVSHSKMREWLRWAVAGVLVLIAISLGIAFVLRGPRPPQPMQAVRLSAEIGVDASLDTSLGASALLSPDGTRLALVARGADQKRRIYVRSLDALQATALSGTEDARNPFFSPDGQWLGFFAEGKLKKISVQGGLAVTLCDAPTDRGGSWGEDGTIVFTPDVQVPLAKVSSAGGSPQPLTTLQAGETTHRWPQILPGGKAVLFTSGTIASGLTLGNTDTVVYSMASGQRKTVQRGGFYARYVPSGHVVYMHEGTLFAMPFDLNRLEVTGQPAPILEGVAASPGVGAAQLSFSETGNLVYVAGRGGGQNVSIYWMDRDGKFQPLRETPSNYLNLAFSPDGKRLLLEIYDGKRRDIWVNEWERDTLTRLTFAGESNSIPVWTPDGQRIVYSSQEKGGTYNLWWMRADGGGNAQRLAESESAQYAGSWRPDSKVLAFSQLNPGASYDIMTLPLEGSEKSGWKPGQPKPFVNSAFTEVAPAFSPDGRWLAYQSNESGSFEVYVRPFPGPGGKWQISTGGGYLPKWSRSGKELFYRTSDSNIMVVAYTPSGDSFHADKPQLWSPGQFTELGVFSYNFDVHPDGKRIAVLKTPGTGQTAAANKVTFIFNFFDELRSKFPSNKN
jgi:Tol biopolymer transport system component/predicted Ser/Thr protein kinase